MPDPHEVYRMGKVPAAVAGEWLARRAMAADLCRIRQDKPLPGVPVTVVAAAGDASCAGRVAAELGGRLVRAPRARRLVHLHDPGVIVEAVLSTA
ncbi:hypothetical protein MF672_043580 [Actinomadura sp. ATCC 31491]|uniref:Uncharacterized protein n=1 Tax=Actinomadura luzonensis TaxID=2805427 RepID=A0ABT0G7S4_9ACTN|nr:hypothetical protein [Actinomadura luzonensis]MCK2220639.1 hypothetical protein [Actinomadura luzonensis]